VKAFYPIVGKSTASLRRLLAREHDPIIAAEIQRRVRQDREYRERRESYITALERELGVRP